MTETAFTGPARSGVLAARQVPILLTALLLSPVTDGETEARQCRGAGRAGIGAESGRLEALPAPLRLCGTAGGGGGQGRAPVTLGFRLGAYLGLCQDDHLHQVHSELSPQGWVPQQL